MEGVGLDKLVHSGTGVFSVLDSFFVFGMMEVFGILDDFFWCRDCVFGITQILEGGGVWMGQDG